MLARTLLIAAMVALAFYLYRRWKQTVARQASAPSAPETMRQCADCGLHLPEKEAISHKQLYFCSEAHKQHYLQEHP